MILGNRRYAVVIVVQDDLEHTLGARRRTPVVLALDAPVGVDGDEVVSRTVLVPVVSLQH
jgi:hypothetical protein